MPWKYLWGPTTFPGRALLATKRTLPSGSRAAPASIESRSAGTIFRGFRPWTRMRASSPTRSCACATYTIQLSGTKYPNAWKSLPPITSAPVDRPK